MMSADDALAAESQSREQKPGPDAEALETASDWLRSALAKGPRLMKELLDEWRNGQGGSERTLKRAKQAVGAEAYREEVPGPWWWRLSAKDAKPPQDEYLGPLGILAENTGNSARFRCRERQGCQVAEPGTLGPNSRPKPPPGTGDYMNDSDDIAGGLRWPRHPADSGRQRGLDIDAAARCPDARPAGPAEAHKAELLALLRPTPIWPQPCPRQQGTPLKPAKAVCRCGSTTWRDVPIHDGQSSAGLRPMRAIHRFSNLVRK